MHKLAVDTYRKKYNNRASVLTVPKNHANFQLHIRKLLKKKMRGKKPLRKKNVDNKKTHHYLGLGQMYIHKKVPWKKSHGFL